MRATRCYSLLLENHSHLASFTLLASFSISFCPHFLSFISACAFLSNFPLRFLLLLLLLTFSVPSPLSSSLTLSLLFPFLPPFLLHLIALILPGDRL